MKANIKYKKIASFLNKKEKVQLGFLFIFLVLGMFLEAIGIGIILPLIDLIQNPREILKNNFFELINDIFMFENEIDLVLFFTISVFIFFLFKGFFLILVIYFQNKFIEKLRARISVKLYSQYLKQTYDFHIKNNSAILLKHIQTDVSHFITFITSFINIITESALILSVLASVVYVNPIGSFIAGISFFLIAAVFNFSFRLKISNWGRSRNNLENEIYKTTLEGIKGYKEIQLFNRISFYTKRFSKGMYKLTDLTSKITTINLAPRYYLEFTAISVLLGFIIFNFTLFKITDDLIVTLSIFIVATFKTIPSVNKILASLQNFKFYNDVVEVIINQLITSKPISLIKLDQNKFEFSNFINLKNLSFNYSKNGNFNLKNINIKINAGETVGIFGPSGSGKSTLVDILVGLIKPTSGDVIIDNKFSIYDNIKSWHKQIGYIPQNIFLTDDTILNNIAIGLPNDQIDLNKISTAIKLSQLEDFINKLPHGIKTHMILRLNFDKYYSVNFCCVTQFFVL